MNNIEIKNRIAAFKIIRDTILKNNSLKNVYAKYFNNLELTNLDRRFVTELVQGTIRMFYRLDCEIENSYNGNIDKLEKAYLIILRIGVYQIIYMNSVPDYAAVSTTVELSKLSFPKYSNLTNALLRKISKNNKTKTDKGNKIKSIKEISIWYSHPLWLVKKWSTEYNDKSLISLLEWNNKSPRVWFRYNENLINFSKIKKTLESLDVKILRHDYLNNFFTTKNAAALIKNILFKSGKISVQSPTNGLIVKLLNPLSNEVILDLCAAPGGKTSCIAESINNSGKIIAYDIDKEKNQYIENNLKRQNINNVTIVNKDVSKSKLFISSKMIADVPCSGTGTIGKNADLRWKKSINDIYKLNLIQEKILNNSSKYLNLNGVILYSTCSIEKEENWMIIDKFLKNHPNYMIDDAKKYIDEKYTDSRGALNIKPHKHNIDGGFAVRLIKYEN